jgi:hypothetical protein
MGTDLLAAHNPATAAALDAAVAGDPYAQGNRWRATRGDSVIDLIGTFHVADARMDAVVAGLEPVIADADTVYLEATEAEMAALQAEITRRPEILFIPQGEPTLPEVLTEDEWQRLAAELSARGIPAFLGSKFRPWYVMMTLALPGCAMADPALVTDGLDKRIGRAAEAAGVPLAPLEPWDTILGIFDALPPEDSRALLAASLAMAAESEDMFATLRAAYFSEEHRRIWEFSRLRALATPGLDPAEAAADFALLEGLLLDTRNRAWIEVILPAAEGRRILVAAGAAHLSGEAGLLPLLAAEGFTLERLPFP